MVLPPGLLLHVVPSAAWVIRRRGSRGGLNAAGGETDVIAAKDISHASKWTRAYLRINHMLAAATDQ